MFGSSLSAVLALALLSAMSTSLDAQGASPQFDVSSIKAHAPGSPFLPPSCPEGRFIAQGVDIAALITWSYDLLSYQRPALPSWTEDRANMFDVEARSADLGGGLSLCKQRVRQMLTTRFKLKSHFEEKEMDVLDLVIEPRGHKMKQSVGVGPDSGVIVKPGGLQVRSLAPRDANSPKGWTMQELAEYLTTFSERKPVLDKTGLGDARFAFTLAFSFRGAGGVQIGDEPELPFAIREQLGLRFEGQRAQVSLFVVDSVAKPYAN